MAYGQESSSFNGANVQASTPPGGSARFKTEENFASLHLEMGNLIEQVQQSLNRMSHLWVMMSKEVEGPASSAAAAAGNMSASLAASMRASGGGGGGLSQGLSSGLGPSGGFAGTRPGPMYSQSSSGENSMGHNAVSGLNSYSEDTSHRMGNAPIQPPTQGPPGFMSAQQPPMMGQGLQPPRKSGSKALAAAAAMAREVEDSSKSVPSGGNSSGNGGNNNHSSNMGPMSVPFSQNEGPMYQGMGGHFLPRTQFQSAPMRVPVGLSPPDLDEADEEEDEDVPLPTHFLNRAHFSSAPIRSVYGTGKLGGGLSSAIGMAGSPGVATVPEACDMALSQHFGRDHHIGTGAVRSFSADAIGPGDYNDSAEMDAAGSGWPTVGSAQHNAGLCKPCLFWYQGLCHKGQRCLFCHIPHDPDEVSRVRPSKKTRNLLQPQKRR
mmetsp:Transcript_30558/g.64817  ORF Transcript_30558/g.64817 Transcript_30558/m.64817 type:complete len:435 (-) Transcript_30558:298-1602(-)